MIDILKNKFNSLFRRDEQHVPPGHFYSPIPDFDNISEDKFLHTFKGLQLNLSPQFQMLTLLKDYFKEYPFKEVQNDRHRFYINNNYFLQSDSFFLFAIIRYLRPKRIIEVGSGFSSALMLDTNELFFNNQIELVFIEPFPDRLQSLVKPTDNYKLYQCPLQEVENNIFGSLEKNDILFIDSSHVVKKGSELNNLLFDVLPSMQTGVKIHFHDMFYPFDYPLDWFKDQKIAWNEAYFLRAFLMYNDAFSIFLWNQFLSVKYEEWFKDNLPFCLSNKGGSLWLNKEK